MDPQLLELVDQLRRYVTALPCLPHAKPTAIEKTAVPPKQAWEAFRLHIVNVHGASPLVDDLASQLTPDRLAAIVNGFERCTGSYGDAKLPLEDTLAFRMWLLTFLAACLTKWGSLSSLEAAQQRNKPDQTRSLRPRVSSVPSPVATLPPVLALYRSLQGWKSAASAEALSWATFLDEHLREPALLVRIKELRRYSDAPPTHLTSASASSTANKTKPDSHLSLWTILQSHLSLLYPQTRKIEITRQELGCILDMLRTCAVLEERKSKKRKLQSEMRHALIKWMDRLMKACQQQPGLVRRNQAGAAVVRPSIQTGKAPERIGFNAASSRPALVVSPGGAGCSIAPQPVTQQPSPRASATSSSARPGTPVATPAPTSHPPTATVAPSSLGHSHLRDLHTGDDVSVKRQVTQGNSTAELFWPKEKELKDEKDRARALGTQSNPSKATAPFHSASSRKSASPPHVAPALQFSAVSDSVYNPRTIATQDPFAQLSSPSVKRDHSSTSTGEAALPSEDSLASAIAPLFAKSASLLPPPLSLKDGLTLDMPSATPAANVLSFIDSAVASAQQTTKLPSPVELPPRNASPSSPSSHGMQDPHSSSSHASTPVSNSMSRDDAMSVSTAPTSPATSPPCAQSPVDSHHAVQLDNGEDSSMITTEPRSSSRQSSPSHRAEAKRKADAAELACPSVSHHVTPTTFPSFGRALPIDESRTLPEYGTQQSSQTKASPTPPAKRLKFSDFVTPTQSLHLRRRCQYEPAFGDDVVAKQTTTLEWNYDGTGAPRARDRWGWMGEKVEARRRQERREQEQKQKQKQKRNEMGGQAIVI